MVGSLHPVRVSQPIGPTQLDWSNSALRAINPIAIFMPVGNRMHEFVNGGQATSHLGTNDLNQPATRFSPNGPGGYCGACGVTGQDQGCYYSGLLPTDSYRFLFTVITIKSVYSTGSTFEHGSHNGTNRFYMGEAGDATLATVNMGWGSTAGTYTRLRPLVGNAVDVLDILAFDVDSAGYMTAYQEGVNIGNSSPVLWSSAGVPTNEFIIGKRQSNLSSYLVAGSASLTHLVIIGRNAVSSAIHKSLAKNPWQIFQASNSLSMPLLKATLTLPSIAQAVSDTTVGGWTSTAATLSQAINEPTRSDAEYISVSSASMSEVLLNNVAYPFTGQTVMKFSGSSTVGSTLRVQLLQHGSILTTWDFPLTSTITDYTAVLTSGEIATFDSSQISARFTTI